METENTFSVFCPLQGMQAAVTVLATLGNGCGCAVSMEDVEASCSETNCPFMHQQGCALNAFLPDAEA